MMGAILLGFLFGLAIQNPLLGVWIGTGVGLFIVAVLWMLDIRKR